MDESAVPSDAVPSGVPADFAVSPYEVTDADLSAAAQAGKRVYNAICAEGITGDAAVGLIPWVMELAASLAYERGTRRDTSSGPTS